jgi:hypothetical protein
MSRFDAREPRSRDRQAARRPDNAWGAEKSSSSYGIRRSFHCAARSKIISAFEPTPPPETASRDGQSQKPCARFRDLLALDLAAATARRVAQLLRARGRGCSELGQGGSQSGVMRRKPRRIQALFPEQELDHQVRATGIGLHILPDLSPDRRRDRWVRHRGPDARPAEEISRPIAIDGRCLNLAAIGD